MPLQWVRPLGHSNEFLLIFQLDFDPEDFGRDQGPEKGGEDAAHDSGDDMDDRDDAAGREHYLDVG
jgi:hypothetical protein